MTTSTTSSMHPSFSNMQLGKLVTAKPSLWIKIGNLESRLLAQEMEAIRVEKPVYICGLARSGSTILLETLADLPDVAGHRYRDFPFIFTPYWWNKTLDLTQWHKPVPRERAHGDGIAVTTESPEAMEEMLWVAFFAHLHSADESNVLSSHTDFPAFEHFYTGHIRKLLLARNARRYVSKGNYNLTRMAYIQKIFPDARFVIPIRDPVTHVESLLRQHRRFSEAGTNNTHIPAYMAMAGHFEFGLNRIPVHAGDNAKMAAILSAWRDGDEIRGFALYWEMLYRFVYEQLLADKALGRATLVIPYENLCDTPRETLLNLLEHCHLPAGDEWIQAKSDVIRPPRYYQSGLTANDKNIIQHICGETAACFGY